MYAKKSKFQNYKAANFQSFKIQKYDVPIFQVLKHFKIQKIKIFEMLKRKTNF